MLEFIMLPTPPPSPMSLEWIDRSLEWLSTLKRSLDLEYNQLVWLQTIVTERASGPMAKLEILPK